MSLDSVARVLRADLVELLLDVMVEMAAENCSIDETELPAVAVVDPDRAQLLSGLVMLHQAIVEQKTQLRDARARVELLADVFQSTGTPVVVLSEALDVEELNPAAERLFGGRPAHVREVCPSFDPAALEAHLARDGQARFEADHVRLDGTPFPAEVRLTVVRPPGRAPYRIATVMDITERRRREQELWWAHQKAEQGNRVKSEFVSNMSHEMGAPMEELLDAVRQVEACALPEPVRSRVREVARCTESLLDVMDGILDFCKLETGKLALRCVPFDLAKCLDCAIARVQPKADARSLELRLRADVPKGSVLGDPGRVEQVLWNLLSHALEFTESGEVVLEVRPVEGVVDRFRFEIADTGIGMSPEQLRYVLACQQRLGPLADEAGCPALPPESSRVPRPRGPGLTVAISQSLLGLMGSTLSVRATLGVGTRVSFELALSRCSESESVERESSVRLSRLASPRRRARVLLLDEPGVNRRVARFLIKSAGHSVVCAESRSEALERFERGAFDVVVMNCGAPGIDAFRVTHELRATDGGRGVPVLGMMVRPSADDRERCLEATMIGCISKPLDASELEQALQHALEVAARRRRVAGP